MTLPNVIQFHSLNRTFLKSNRISLFAVTSPSLHLSLSRPLSQPPSTRAPQDPGVSPAGYLYSHSTARTYLFIMNWVFSVLLAAFFAQFSYAFDCSAKELRRFKVDSLKGIYLASNTKETPPSTSTIEWHIGICQDIGKVEGCSADADICGKVTMENNGQKMLTEVFEFKTKDFSGISLQGDRGSEGFTAEYNEVEWSDQLINAHLIFQCVNEKDAEREFRTLWNGKWLSATIKTDKACPDFYNRPINDGDDEEGESWGWFTWIFIFIVLFLSIYIIGGAWFQYNKGNAIDFQSALKEVLENFIDLLRGLPAFVREIIEKFTRNNNRGEYSAV